MNNDILEMEDAGFDHKSFIGMVLDVPAGEEYGFPKVYDGSEKDVYEWITKQGYPKEYLKNSNFIMHISPKTPTTTTTVKIDTQ